MMRVNSFLLVMFLISSCHKKGEVVRGVKNDSVSVSEESSPIQKSNSTSVLLKDSVNIKKVKEDSILKTDKPKKSEIIKFVNGDQLPFVITEKFTKENQTLVLKIFNYHNAILKGSISTSVQDFNIRFNQIKLANGSLDGPFGKDITYNIPKKGDIMLFIGKSNMASGTTIGEFSVRIE